MVDIRPAGYVIGLLLIAFGATMVLPFMADVVLGADRQTVFATAAIVTMVAGATLMLACANAAGGPLRLQESFILVSGIWIVFPAFGALPFMFGAPDASLTDAVFEAVSAMTTTGSTVFVHLDELPPGTLLWRGLLQWFGGLGIVVVAMVFLPTLGVGGMQLFRSEAFDTLGKIMPKATEIALSLTWIYVVLTLMCAMGYLWTGMSGFDALVHSLTTLATGGMANYDSSFADFSPGAHYVAVVFMICATLPFVRYVQLVNGSARPLLRDSQVRAYLAVIAVFVVALTLWLTREAPGPLEPAFREVLFNVVSIITGTGYSSADYNAWGAFAMAIFFVIGLIGGCSSSTGCSVKIFRYQVLISAIAAEVNRMHSPNRVFVTRYDGRPIDPATLNSVIAFFMFFFLTLGVLAVALTLLGLDLVTAISGAATAVANIGPGLGPEIGPTGNFAGLPDAAKWTLAIGMLIGRLEVLSILVIASPAFWRA